MGCLQSVACKARVRREQIVVSDVSATIEPAATAIEESSPVVLRYRTPYFRASARVLMPPIARRHTWVVGWIQACNHMEFYNTYSDLGVSSWELPDLREGRVKAISDSDGVSYPWYGNTTETVTLVGPTNKISRFSGNARSMSAIEPCLWQMLLSTQLEVEAETMPAGRGGLLRGTEASLAALELKSQRKRFPDKRVAPRWAPGWERMLRPERLRESAPQNPQGRARAVLRGLRASCQPGELLWHRCGAIWLGLRELVQGCC
ncbi:protein FAM78B isoform 2-T2 [Spheniscus humboldti]